jgi:hypothetical protein
MRCRKESVTLGAERSENNGIKGASTQTSPLDMNHTQFIFRWKFYSRYFLLVAYELMHKKYSYDQPLLAGHEPTPAEAQRASLLGYFI